MIISNSSETLAPKTALATYGKSFHWAKRFLGARMGANAAQLYQFCRVLDDMADGDINDGPHRLSIIRKDLLATGKALDPLMIAYQTFLAKHQLSQEVIVTLIDGLLSDQNPARITTESQLLRYAYHVAGTVGILMCDVLDCRDDRALNHAIDLGIAMQLTNIARDVLEDAKMGRRYLPESWVGKLEPSQIFAFSGTPSNEAALPIYAAVEKLLLLADTYYKSGMAGLTYLPIRAHISIAIAALVYRQIGVQISNTHYAWHRGRAVTNSFTKLLCSIKALGTLSKRWHPKNPHNSKLHHQLKGLPHVG